MAELAKRLIDKEGLIYTYNAQIDSVVKKLCEEILSRLDSLHIRRFLGMDAPLFLISECYPGVWHEHVYDSVFYAMLDPTKLHLAENTVNLFLDKQKEDGQLPCFIKDGNAPEAGGKTYVGYSQIQECVSFARLGFLVYKMNRDKAFLDRLYRAAERWVGWLRKHRMTLGLGLVEMFFGYDTGHDNSGRLNGMKYPKNIIFDDGSRGSAKDVPPEDDIAPIIAVDMNCNFFGTLTALSEIASELGLSEDAVRWTDEAAEVKRRLFDVCFDKEDCFFYDVDKNGVKRKHLSSTVFHLFMEKMLDKNEDKELICELYERHISNPDEFATPYPYPSMAVCDPSCDCHAEKNCWGYYSQGLIALRCTLWMDEYGFSKDFDRLCEAWVETWTKHYGNVNFGQEIDPISGVPTDCSEWYSSTMLFYLYACKRLQKTDNKKI